MGRWFAMSALQSNSSTEISKKKALHAIGETGK
jgi:hypothetical protein